MLTIADTGEIERLVLEGALDLGVVGSRSTHGSVIQHELWKDELVLAVSVQHRLAGKKAVSLEQLTEEPFILREVGSGTLRIMEDYLQGAGPRGSGSLEVVARLGTSTAVKEGIKAGLGISILSSRAVETETKAGILKTLKVKGLSMSRSFYLIRDKRRVASPLCRAMLDFLVVTSCERKGKGKK